MSDLSTYWNGQPPSTQLQGFTPWIQAPSYSFSSKLYGLLESMLGQPAPRWGGFGGMANTARKQNPYIQDLTNLATNYYGLGMSTPFQQATGNLSRFMNPSYQSPLARMQLGAVNYMGNSAIPSPYAGMGGS